MPILWTMSDFVAKILTQIDWPRKAYSKVWVVGTTEELHWLRNSNYVCLKAVNYGTALNVVAAA